MRPKRSAEGVAALRFAASFEADPAVRGPDRIAGSLLSRHLQMIGRVGVLRYPVLRRYRRVLPGIYEYHIIRSAYIDQIVTREVAAGCEQFVIVGAGFDTRAIWMRDSLTHTRVFEVDHPATSRQKQSRLARLGRLPSNLTFVAVDFETADLTRALRDAGYRTDSRSVFVWEGVSMFLTEPAVVKTLNFFATAAPASVTAFDYITRSVAEGKYETAYGSRQAAHYLATLGEPYRFGLEHYEVRPFLAHHGLILERCDRAPELADRYLTRSDGRLLGQVNSFHGLAVTRSPSAG
jgi:methyltransferase (TIGR00027 family)